AAFHSAFYIRLAIIENWDNLRPAAEKHLPNITRAISELAPQLTELRIDAGAWSSALRSVADGSATTIPYKCIESFPDIPVNHWVFEVLITARVHGLNSQYDVIFSVQSPPASFDIVFA